MQIALLQPWADLVPTPRAPPSPVSFPFCFSLTQDALAKQKWAQGKLEAEKARADAAAADLASARKSAEEASKSAGAAQAALEARLAALQAQMGAAETGLAGLVKQLEGTKGEKAEVAAKLISAEQQLTVRAAEIVSTVRARPHSALHPLPFPSLTPCCFLQLGSKGSLQFDR